MAGRKKILIAIVILFGIASLYEISDTLALFQSEKPMQIDSNIAAWNISVNNSNITSSNSFLINTVNWENSSFVKNGKVAPGVSGYFDIAINPNDTDVSIRYDITFDFSNLNSGEFVVENIAELVNGNLLQTNENTYTGIISLNEIKNNVTNTVRVYIDWVNNNIYNEEDSAIGTIPNNVIFIPVTVDITQYFGEEIVAY